MMWSAHTREVAGVSRAAVFPVAQMVHFDAAGGAAAGDDTGAAVAVFDGEAGVVGHGAVLAAHRGGAPVAVDDQPHRRVTAHVARQGLGHRWSQMEVRLTRRGIEVGEGVELVAADMQQDLVAVMSFAVLGVAVGCHGDFGQAHQRGVPRGFLATVEQLTAKDFESCRDDLALLGAQRGAQAPQARVAVVAEAGELGLVAIALEPRRSIVGLVVVAVFGIVPLTLAVAFAFVGCWVVEGITPHGPLQLRDRHVFGNVRRRGVVAGRHVPHDGAHLILGQSARTELAHHTRKLARALGHEHQRLRMRPRHTRVQAHPMLHRAIPITRPRLQFHHTSDRIHQTSSGDIDRPRQLRDARLQLPCFGALGTINWALPARFTCVLTARIGLVHTCDSSIRWPNCTHICS
jgi:hypothetical protein